MFFVNLEILTLQPGWARFRKG